MSPHIHLIAICGTAMGTLAGMLKAKGFKVSGSDENVYPPMSTQLEKWQIPLQKGFKAENLDPKPDLVIVGNAVSKTNPEVAALLDSRIEYLSLPQALGRFFLEEKKSLVVAGTHGKTTSTSLLAWMLHESGLDPSFLVGGIPQNFNSSFRLGKGDYFVIEGDEYDTAFFDKGPKFWHYHPYQAILTGVEFDHADIYRDLEHVKSAFQKFIELIPANGALYYCGDNPIAVELSAFCKGRKVSYGFDSACEFRAENIQFNSEGVEFDFYQNANMLTRFQCPLPGKHNLQNLLGVLALCLNLYESNHKRVTQGLPCHPSLQKLQEAISQFKSVKRRQEVRGRVNNITLIDDFAHHPTAIAETIDAIKGKYPGQKVWAIFEPRSNTSKRAIFQHDFPRALAHADEVLLAKVFMPEKVKDSALLDVSQVAKDLTLLGIPTQANLEVDEIVLLLQQKAKPGDVLLVMSNGGFGGIHQKLLEVLRKIQ